LTVGKLSKGEGERAQSRSNPNQYVYYQSEAKEAIRQYDRLKKKITVFVDD